MKTVFANNALIAFSSNDERIICVDDRIRVFDFELDVVAETQTPAGFIAIQVGFIANDTEVLLLGRNKNLVFEIKTCKVRSITTLPTSSILLSGFNTIGDKQEKLFLSFDGEFNRADKGKLIEVSADYSTRQIVDLNQFCEEEKVFWHSSTFHFLEAKDNSIYFLLNEGIYKFDKRSLTSELAASLPTSKAVIKGAKRVGRTVGSNFYALVTDETIMNTLVSVDIARSKITINEILKINENIDGVVLGSDTMFAAENGDIGKPSKIFALDLSTGSRTPIAKIEDTTTRFFPSHDRQSVIVMSRSGKVTLYHKMKANRQE